MSLEQLMQTRLPMNRKERFFTGTVFPAIVCAEDFARFDRLLRLLPGSPQATIDPSPSRTNVQVFTEYGLAESIYGQARSRFSELPVWRDTPDIVIFIEGDPPLLIALEAKMYDRPTVEALAEQMSRQRRYVLDYLARELSIPEDRVIHAALVPRDLLNGSTAPGFDVVTWEALLDAFAEGRDEDYFLGMLRLALESYDDLVSKADVAYGANAKARIPGAEIYTKARAGSLGYSFMGRYQGLGGEALLEDLQSGRWTRQVYEVTDVEEAPNRNWFAVADFLELVDTIGAKGDPDGS